MPPNSVNMTGMIRDFSAYEVFAQHTLNVTYITKIKAKDIWRRKRTSRNRCS
jgi:hypothetical protein